MSPSSSNSLRSYFSPFWPPLSLPPFFLTTPSLPLTYKCCIWLLHVFLNTAMVSPQPTVCTNPNCVNRRRFMLDINQSHFVDFQKVRIQETQQELPRGSIPRRYNVHVYTYNTCLFTSYLMAVHFSFSLSPPLSSPSLPPCTQSGGDFERRGSGVSSGWRQV